VRHARCGKPADVRQPAQTAEDSLPLFMDAIALAAPLLRVRALECLSVLLHRSERRAPAAQQRTAVWIADRVGSTRTRSCTDAALIFLSLERWQGLLLPFLVEGDTKTTEPKSTERTEASLAVDIHSSVMVRAAPVM
jgi:hypothetical protein